MSQKIEHKTKGSPDKAECPQCGIGAIKLEEDKDDEGTFGLFYCPKCSVFVKARYYSLKSGKV